MKHKRKAIFFDEGARWKKVKKVSIGTLFLLLGVLFLAGYALFYSPFLGISDLFIPDKIDLAVDEINNVSRPVVDGGTFVTVEDIYGTTYVKRSGEDQKMVILTFDDGPDIRTTPKILDILRRENVPATFFVVGKQVYKYPEIGQHILDQGSDMGLHTFSHEENVADKTLSRSTFIRELDFTEKLFSYYYGFKTNLFRVPYMGLEEKLSYNSLQYIREAQKRGLTVSAPTVDAEDWNAKLTTQQVTKLATTSDVQTVVVLLHDAGGNRNTTVIALPDIIKFYKDKGYQFSTISEYAKNQGLPYQKTLTFKDKVFSSLAFHAFNFYMQSPQWLTQGFIIGFILVLFHSGIFIFFALLQIIIRKIQSQQKKRIIVSRSQQVHYLVSVIIPMYNEEKSIVPTIRAILRSSYKYIEVLVVDDGSTDTSASEVKKRISDPRVTLLQTVNKGKWNALNYGLKYAKGKYTICIDADTRVKTSAIRSIIMSFSDKRVGAVAGTIHIGNRKNLITKLQSVEYVLAQGIDKRVQDLFGAVMVVPGAFGAWRTSALRKVKGFTQHTHSEDFDVTLALIEKGYKVHYSSKAIAYTEAPLTLTQLYIQRFRWNFGNLQVYAKYKNLLFRRKFGLTGMVFLPRTLFLHVPSVILMPIVDIIIIFNLFFGERTLTLSFLSIYIVLNIGISFLAHAIMHKSLLDSLYTPFLRIYYAQLMYFIFYMTLVQALRGEIIAWSKLHHVGRLSTIR